VPGADPGVGIPRVEDPTATIIDNKYFLNTKPGEQGLIQVDAKMKKQKADFEEYKRKVEAAQKAKGAGHQNAHEGKQAFQQVAPIPVPAK